MRSARQVIAVLGSALVVWLGLAQPAYSADAPLPPCPATYCYDVSDHKSAVPTTATERSPPVSYLTDTTHSTINHRLGAATACSEAVVSEATTSCTAHSRSTLGDALALPHRMKRY